jgi:Protein of unknown function (DUF3604)
MALALLALAAGTRAGTAPWARTETREPCAGFDLLRRPFFGDLHVHTRCSADAYIFGTRVTPHEAYDFMRGVASVTLADDNEDQTRSAHIQRPLDFGAVTDHSEFLGEVNLCSTPGFIAYDDMQCQILRQAEPNPADQFVPIALWQYLVGSLTPPRTSHIFCDLPGVDCDAAAVSVWQEMQTAAEAAYDRSATCGFTSFVAYEHTASPLGRHMHRNVIFRNEHVPAIALSHLETYAGGTPQGLWSAIETQCLNAGTGCDALLIPHNSNLSEGRQFSDPADAAEAARRQVLEPLVEIHQQKSASECRFDRLAGIGAGTADELCTFEQRIGSHEGPGPQQPIATYPLRNMVRNALKDGLLFEQTLGANPFRFGFIGSTDNHNGTGGVVDESGWQGGEGNNDSSPARQISEDDRNNPGGLAVVWAEENSRDAIFDALRRRETYATSGTRPVIRFFAGNLDGVACGSSDLVHAAYLSGTPMGGEIGPLRGDASPRFVVWAMKDPGTLAEPGTDLQRIQIVKGWVDAAGQTHEHVFDVAGDATLGAVDPATCTPTGAGFADLCTTWEDPTFVRGERAFYYVRLLENPTCRWSTLVCRSVGVDPLSPDCATQAAAAGPDFADCCLGPGNDPYMEPIIQERAWTSPIWYRPDGIARLKARIRFGQRPGHDVLALKAWLGDDTSLDPATNDLIIRVSDAATIFEVTVPAGRLGRGTSGPRVVRIPGVGRISLTGRAKPGPLIRLTSVPLDLSQVDRTDHMLTVTIESALYRLRHTRLWAAAGRGLATTTAP